MNPLRKDCIELGFTIFAKPDDYSVEYEVFELPFQEAAPFVHGHVKWDGCSNWYFDAQDSCMIHGCDKDDLLNLGKVLGACWDWTKELCPKWQDMECARPPLTDENPKEQK